MATETLIDSSNNVLGSIETNADGSQVLRDANGTIRGITTPRPITPEVLIGRSSPKGMFLEP